MRPEKLRFKRIVIPGYILDDGGLSAGARETYGKLMRLSFKKGYCWPSNSALDGTESGNTAARHIKELQKRGYLTTKEVCKKRKIFLQEQEMKPDAEATISGGPTPPEMVADFTRNGGGHHQKWCPDATIAGTESCQYGQAQAYTAQQDTEAENTKNGARTVLDEQVQEQVHLTGTEEGKSDFSKSENANADGRAAILASLHWDKPLGADDSFLVIPWWHECCKFWNSLGLKPQCRYFLIMPARYASEIVKTFHAFSLKDILNAIESYSNHRKSTSEDYVPAMTYGSIDTFLVGGVQRYFDDSALDDLFKDRTKSRRGK